MSSGKKLKEIVGEVVKRVLVRRAGKPASNTPKGKKSAWMLFCGERRPELMRSFPDLTMAEVTSKLGTEWRDIPEGGKAEFEREVEKEKERFAIEMASFVPDPSEYTHVTVADRGSTRTGRDELDRMAKAIAKEAVGKQ
jgi:hypothetical protein